MKRRQFIIFLLIVVTPLALIGWLGWRVTRDEQDVLRHRTAELLASQLKENDKTIASLLQENQRKLTALTELSTYDADSLRQLTRSTPLARQVFLLDQKGGVLHPPVLGAMLESERDFLRRTRRLLLDKDLIHAPSGESKTGVGSQGWHVWYWENGLNLIFWRRLENGQTIGVELEPGRLVADIIARLPETDPKSGGPASSIALIDSNGGQVYRWGLHSPEANELPRASVALSAPLHSWHLDYFLSGAQFDSSLQSSTLLNLGAVLTISAIALLALAFYFFREHSREALEAAQRVNFVNQVSHELKTPLTNIRMYAELLDERLPDDSADSASPVRRYLGVIVSESQRLSRLIANVLTFAQQQKNALSLYRKPASADEVIRATLEHFRPAFESKSVDVKLDADADAVVQIDPDALGQIIANLFSNVEKYGASGGMMFIESRQSGGRITIVVADCGPGIPDSESQRLFKPFERLSNKLTDGVTGTGIGLTIARELARLHGGDLILEKSESGARFKLWIESGTPSEMESRQATVERAIAPATAVSPDLNIMKEPQ